MIIKRTGAATFVETPARLERYLCFQIINDSLLNEFHRIDEIFHLLCARFEDLIPRHVTLDIQKLCVRIVVV